MNTDSTYDIQVNSTTIDAENMNPQELYERLSSTFDSLKIPFATN